MKCQQLFLVVIVLFCACDIVKYPNTTKMSILYFSYVPKDHPRYGRKGAYELLIENLTTDTIVWEKKIEVEGEQFTLHRNEPIRILPKEKVIKRVNVSLKDNQLKALSKGITPKLFVIEEGNKYELAKHELFTLCNKIKEHPCSEKRKLEILIFRQF